MPEYVKLFSTILDSSIMAEPVPTRWIWTVMLAMKDRDGIVGASVGGLARRAGVTRDEVEAALATFLAPDPDSRTKEDDGRRIEVVDGGWRVINHQKYRDLESIADRREKDAARQRRARERQALVGMSRDPSRDVTPGHASHGIRSETDQIKLRAEEPLAPDPIATELRPGAVTGHELKRLFAAFREREVPGALGWQTPVVRDGKETSMAEMINADPTARADVAPTMELLFRKAKDGKCGKNSPLVLEKPAFGFACWMSDWTSLREELRGAAGPKKTRMELAQEAEAASWANR